MPGKRRQHLGVFGLACVMVPLVSLAPAWAGQPPAQPITESCAGPIVGEGQPVCGTLNPGVSEKVGYYFAYNIGADCAGGDRTPANPEIEGEDVAVSDNLTNLAPATKYSYCLVATNSFGETFGEAWAFRTPAGQLAAQEAPPASAVLDTAIVSPASFAAPAEPSALERMKRLLAKRMKACGAMPIRRRVKCRRQARKRYERARQRYEG
jgi:hypothetical protein